MRKPTTIDVHIGALLSADARDRLRVRFIIDSHSRLRRISFLLGVIEPAYILFEVGTLLSISTDPTLKEFNQLRSVHLSATALDSLGLIESHHALAV